MALLREAQRYPGKEREVFEFYQKAPEVMAKLRAPIFEDKVVDFIIDLAQVTDRSVTPEALRKEMESETEEGASETKKKSAKPKKAKPAKEPAKAAGGKETQSGAKKKATPRRVPEPRHEGRLR